MRPINKQYIKEMKNKYGGYHATWAPGVPLQVGDIGDFDKDGVFQKLANLKNRKIDFEVLIDEKSDQFDYTSQNSVSVKTKLAGEIAPNSVLKDIDAGVIVEFSKGSSVLFKAKDVKYHSIEDVIQLEEDVIELYNKGKWKKEWCVITELAVAESATIIIANGSSSKIELKANANIGASKIDIADASLDFSIQSAKDMNTTIIAQEGLTPLFKVRKLKFTGISQPIPTGLRIHNVNATSDVDSNAKEISLDEYKPEETGG